MVLLATALGGCAAMPDPGSTGERLDRARAGILPPLGATEYTLDRQRLLDQPGGENQLLASSLARLPGVAVGPGGQVRVRGQQHHGTTGNRKATM